jgi:hypothetical protein
MKNLLKISFVFVFLIGINQSCTDLETEVFSELTADNFPKTDEQFIAALGATYSSLTNAASHNSYWSNQSVSSDEMMIPQRGPDWFDGGYWLRLHRHEPLATDDVHINGWNTLYGGINNANRVIELFEGLVAEGSVSQDAAAAFIGELKVLRAYQYWWLMDQYGNVPIVTQFAGGEANPPTVPRAQVFAFVEQELNENVPNLTRAKDGSTYGRFNYWAGKALQSRLYLNAQVYTGSPRWADAAAAANEVINSGLYSLESNYFNNFNVENQGSSENIFVVPYDRTQNCCNQIPWMTLHYGSDQTFGLAAQPWNGYCALEEFYNKYDNTDLRKGKFGDQKTRGNFIAGPQYEADGVTPINDSSVEGNDPDGAGLVFTPQINEHFPNALRQAGVRIGKYEFEAGANGTASNDWVLLRYAEVLLNKAEADFMQGNQSGLPLVNMIRQRAALSGYTALTAENLLDERARELFFEGTRRSDLIRHGKWGDPWDFKPASGPNKALMPIPQQALDANPALQQNPGYN